MSNSRITKKERALLIGVIRRVFSRSDLRRAVMDAARIEHCDPSRPRVKKWGMCVDCKMPTALYEMQCDHRDPVIPTNLTSDTMSWDTVVDRTWCPESNLAAVCKACHREKTLEENKERRRSKKGTKK